MDSMDKRFKDSSAVRGCREFSTDFHKTLTKMTKNNNVVHSPLGVHQLLSLLFHGADGLSAKEMVAGLHLSDTTKLHLGYQDILSQIKHSSRTVFIWQINEEIKNMVTLANGIFVNDGITLTNAFKSKSTEYYQVEHKTAIFDKKKESADAINSWISEKTQNKINNMFLPENICPLTQVILVSALYFKAQWTNRFDSMNTKKETFYISKTLQTEVFMMHQKSFFRHGKIPNLKSTFIEFPYEIRDMDMIVIRPDTIEGLEFVEKHFDWNVVINAQRSCDFIDLSLPKFKIEATNNLKEVLCKMGMKSMFEPRGDFERLCTAKLLPPLHVSNVMQKVFIDVNEMGTEAAAVTYVSLRGGGYPPPPKIFEVDRPFIVAIRQISTNIPLFIASVRDIGKKQSIASDIGGGKRKASDYSSYHEIDG